MSIWRKLKKSAGGGLSASRKPAAPVTAIGKILLKFDAYLQARTKNVPPIRLRIMLAIFCLTWGGLSVYLILNSFSTEKRAFISIQKIQLPRYSGKTGEENLRVQHNTENRAGSKMQLFIDSMDVLKNSVTGRHVYDSILRTRPQLMDSIRRLNILQSNKK